LRHVAQLAPELQQPQVRFDDLLLSRHRSSRARLSDYILTNPDWSCSVRGGIGAGRSPGLLRRIQLDSGVEEGPNRVTLRRIPVRCGQVNRCNSWPVYTVTSVQSVACLPRDIGAIRGLSTP
jgi:hypothetical protein